MKDHQAAAEQLLADGDVEGAASAYDQAYALAPDDQEITAARAALLDSLAVVEHGIRFRYVPAGLYTMGSVSGDPDEQPVRNVQLDAFWLSETPVTWAAFCRLLGWEPPPYSAPADEGELPQLPYPGFHLHEANKIRLQYCEDFTSQAVDWHAHDDGMAAIFGSAPRGEPAQPKGYDTKPMVSVAWQEAEKLAETISTETVRYRLPTEAEWEAAARGGLAGQPFPWGGAPPTAGRCDFGRFDEFAIKPPKSFAPNGYGLYGMSGGVWEWTSDRYDAFYYSESPRDNPRGPEQGEERVIRGGSWADCAEVVTVSFRASRAATPYWEGGWGEHMAPNIGFRLCRVGQA